MIASENQPTYCPVDCGFHDLLESLAVRRKTCEVVFQSAEGDVHTYATRILDVFTEGQEEFVQLQSGAKVRLDRLHSVAGVKRPGAGEIGCNPRFLS